MEQKELDRAQVYCEAAVAISDWLDDIDEQSSCYYSLGNLLRLQSHFDAARMAGEKSLRASQLTGSRATEANVLVMLALIEKDAHLQQKSGDLARALQFAQQSVAIYEEIEFEWGRAAGLITLGLVQFELGDYEAARQTWDGGLHLAESLSSQVLIARYAELLTWLPKP
jgi:tetratricopeptide (TPR) repeat protein